MSGPGLLEILLSIKLFLSLDKRSVVIVIQRDMVMIFIHVSFSFLAKYVSCVPLMTQLVSMCLCPLRPGALAQK